MVNGDGVPSETTSTSGSTVPVPPADEAIDPPSAPSEGGANRFKVSTYIPPEPEVQFADRVHRTPEEKAASLARRAKRRKRRKIIAWSMVGAGAVILIGTAWAGWRSYQAYTHLENASADVATLQDQIKDITSTDPAATAATVAHLQAEAGSAASAVDDPVYRAVSYLPLIGPNLDAIRDVTLTVNSLATDVMPSLLVIAQTLQPAQLAPVDGTIDLAPIEEISPLLQTADAAVNQASDTIAAIDRSTVVQPIGDAVLTLTKKLEQAADVTGPGARIARLLPPMLGADGARTYLVVFQNPAEPRATGGMFGSFAVVTADQGKITIVDQGAASRTLGIFKPPAAQLTSDELNLYGKIMATYPADVNLTPDFPRAASLFAEMYQQRSGTAVDGVLALDPVALSYMLKGSPPIDVGGGVSVTSENLVSVLLSTAYEKFEGLPSQSERDTFLAQATGKVFSNMMSGKGDAKAILNGLRQAATERRVLLYSANGGEQQDISATDIAGALNRDEGAPTIGVFFNDGTGAKLGYYLSSEVHVTEGDCQQDGRRALNVQVVLHYDAPADGLPEYVTGYTPLGKAYTLRTNVLVSAPFGGEVNSALKDGTAVTIGQGNDAGRDVGQASADLKPGTSTELTFTVLGPPNSDNQSEDVLPALMLAPGISPWVSSVEPYRECLVKG